jgi:hypothetical protein
MNIKSSFTRRLSTLGWIALALSWLPSSATMAQTDDEYIKYEQIVKELQSQVDRPEVAAPVIRTKKPKAEFTDSFADIMIHVGLGGAIRTQTVGFNSAGAASNFNLFERGYQGALGVDLFSKRWLVEGTVRSFASQDNPNLISSLKEIEMKLLYRQNVQPSMEARYGFGLGARSLSISTPYIQISESTPVAIGSVGFGYYINSMLSVGVEGAVRSAMISDSRDRFSVDGTVRVDSHF